MSLVSKTVLQQMRFVSKGGAFCNIAANTSITDTSDFYRQGQPFFGVETEITPPVYTYISAPIRQGQAENTVALRQIRYGGVTKGQPIFSQLPNPTYTPYLSSPVRKGTAFRDITANPAIDASSDFYRDGAPFYVYYAGIPVAFDATRMFIIF